MNKFDKLFFSKYIPNWIEMLWVVHKHIIVIIDKILITFLFWALLPSFLYYYSDSIKGFLPFFVLEILIICVFLKNLYDIFNWYNDVWILTKDWVIDLEWWLLSSDSVSIKYEWVEWLQIIEKWFIDTFLKKWDIVINKIWWWEKFLLEDAYNPYKAVDEIDFMCSEAEKNKKSNKKPIKTKEQNFETVLKALTQVVEWYLEWNGYKKDDSEEKKALIKEVKKKWGAIDLSE